MFSKDLVNKDLKRQECYENSLFLKGIYSFLLRTVYEINVMDI